MTSTTKLIETNYLEALEKQLATMEDARVKIEERLRVLTGVQARAEGKKRRGRGTGVAFEAGRKRAETIPLPILDAEEAVQDNVPTAASPEAPEPAVAKAPVRPRTPTPTPSLAPKTKTPEPALPRIKKPTSPPGAPKTPEDIIRSLLLDASMTPDRISKLSKLPRNQTRDLLSQLAREGKIVNIGYTDDQLWTWRPGASVGGRPLRQFIFRMICERPCRSRDLSQYSGATVPEVDGHISHFKRTRKDLKWRGRKPYEYFIFGDWWNDAVMPPKRGKDGKVVNHGLYDDDNDYDYHGPNDDDDDEEG